MPGSTEKFSSQKLSSAQFIALLNHQMPKEFQLFSPQEAAQKLDIEYIAEAHNPTRIEDFVAVGIHHALPFPAYGLYATGHYKSELISKNDVVIPAKTIIGFYTGEYLEDDNRHSRYVFDVEENGKRMIIDAEHKGNATRFMNHSNSPNVKAENYKSGTRSLIRFKAIRNIYLGEELTVYYGDCFFANAQILPIHPCYPGWMSTDFIFNQYSYILLENQAIIKKIKSHFNLSSDYRIAIHRLHVDIINNEFKNIHTYERTLYQLPILILDQNNQPLLRSHPKQIDLMPLALAKLAGTPEMVKELEKNKHIKAIANYVQLHAGSPVALRDRKIIDYNVKKQLRGQLRFKPYPKRKSQIETPKPPSPESRSELMLII